VCVRKCVIVYMCVFEYVHVICCIYICEFNIVRTWMLCGYHVTYICVRVCVSVLCICIYTFVWRLCVRKKCVIVYVCACVCVNMSTWYILYMTCMWMLFACVCVRAHLCDCSSVCVCARVHVYACVNSLMSKTGCWSRSDMKEVSLIGIGWGFDGTSS
jgi:hypothetical protein